MALKYLAVSSGKKRNMNCCCPLRLFLLPKRQNGSRQKNNRDAQFLSRSDKSQTRGVLHTRTSPFVFLLLFLSPIFPSPSFLPPSLSLSFLFLFPSLSLSLPSPPQPRTLFPSRNQKEMDAAPREQHREGTGRQKEVIQVSRVLGGPGHRPWQAQRQMPSPRFNLHRGAEWQCGDVAQWGSPNSPQRWAHSCQSTCLPHTTWKIMDQGKEPRQGTTCFLNLSTSANQSLISF